MEVNAKIPDINFDFEKMYLKVIHHKCDYVNKKIQLYKQKLILPLSP